ncbi:hypothetical protein AB0K60_28235 [Thermopolyspora sp. NPDC052614]|uniref:hypothetical protein n=1 Tax=Thermopolyspora sp. NPDC052614 TaxID=3155682 RepID=UPI003423D38D
MTRSREIASLEVVVIGLPGSGKTSLIARSWNAARRAGLDFRLPWKFPDEDSIRSEIAYEKTHRSWGVRTSRETALRRRLLVDRIGWWRRNAAYARRLSEIARAARRGRAPAGTPLEFDEWWLRLSSSSHVVVELVDMPWTDLVEYGGAALPSADGVVLTVDADTPGLDGWRTTRTLVNCLQIALPADRRIPVVLALTGRSRGKPEGLPDGLLTYLAAAESAGRARGLTVPVTTHGWRPRNSAVPIAWLIQEAVPSDYRPVSRLLTPEVRAGGWPDTHSRLAPRISDGFDNRVLTPPLTRVVVLGEPGAGRTALLAAMNRGLDPSSGLWLHLPRYEQHHALADMWDGIVSGAPVPVPEDTRYGWELVDGAVPIMQVDWHEPPEPAVGSEACVIITIDASRLRDPLTPTTIRHVASSTRADQINRALTAQIAQRRASGAALPFVIVVVTKTDLIRLGDGYSRSRPMLVNDLAQLLPDVFAAEDLIVAVTTTEMPRPARTATETLRARGTELLAYLLFWYALRIGQESKSMTRRMYEKARDDQIAKANAARDKASSWEEQLGVIGRAIGWVYGRKADKAYGKARESEYNAQSAASVIEWVASFRKDLTQQLAEVTFLRGGVPFVPNLSPEPEEGL